MQGIGKDLSADILMYGHIEKQNNAYQVTMFLFDVARKTREKTYPETIPLSEATGPSLAGWARKIYGKLTGQTDTCVIVVKTNGVDSGTILVNGAPKGSITNGVGQVNGLTEGRYKLAVEAKDYHRWEKSDITCTAGQTTNVPAELEKRESTSVVTDTNTTTGTTGLGSAAGTGSDNVTGSISHAGGPSPWLYVAIGAGAVAVASFTFGAVESVKLKNTYSDNNLGTNGENCMSQGGTFSGSNKDACNTAHGEYKDQFYGYIAGGVLAGVAVVALVETLRHHGDSDEHAALGHRTRPPIAIVPVVSPSGGGVTFSMRW
jgi:hypothetical protein